MAMPQFVCKNNCKVTGLKGWYDAVTRWHDGFKCHSCDSKVRWLGVWPPPKAFRHKKPEHYEVVHVIGFDGGFGLKWYKPVVLICKPRRSVKLVIWPRYWITPAGRPKFGQDGPHIRPDGLQFLYEEVQKFISQYEKTKSV
jgi:hypothetical protein